MGKNSNHKRLLSLRAMIKGLVEELQIPTDGKFLVSDNHADPDSIFATEKVKLHDRLLKLYSTYFDEYNTRLYEIDNIEDTETRAIMLWRIRN